MARAKKQASGKISIKHLRRDTQDNIQYYLMLVIPLILIAIFCYGPLFGLVIAFQDYAPGRPFFGEGVEWVGLKWFEKFVNSFYFERIMRNTVTLSMMTLIIGFPVPIIFALLINEIKSIKFKNFIQTVSYMPHFLSIVIVAALVKSFVADDGIITMLLRALGFKASEITTNREFFPWLYTMTGIWMSFGWNSILYLSTISSIDPQLYEAASLDGASRLKQIWHVTLPALMPLIIIQLILAIGGLLSSNTELILQLYNPSVYETADVIGTYTYREALLRPDYSYGTASGLLLSIFAFILTCVANAICRKTTDWSMW